MLIMIIGLDYRIHIEFKGVHYNLRQCCIRWWCGAINRGAVYQKFSAIGTINNLNPAVLAKVPNVIQLKQKVNSPFHQGYCR